MNYSLWLNKWLSDWVKPVVKPSTFEKYSSIARFKLAPRLGGFEISKIPVHALQGFTAELAARYSPNTVTGIVAVLKSSLSCAYTAGVAGVPPCGCIKLPKAPRTEPPCLTVAQQKKLEKHVLESRSPKLFGIVLCLYTGLRIGELLALEWSDIDFARGKINVVKTCRDGWTANGYKKLIGEPKTPSSRRVIPVPRQLMPYLSRAKKNSQSLYLISGSRGKDLPVRSYQRTFKALLKKLNLPPCSFHALRHTFATRALECGMDVKSLAQILGHKNPDITLKRYAHSFAEHRGAMMNRLGRLFTADPAIDKQ